MKERRRVKRVKGAREVKGSEGGEGGLSEGTGSKWSPYAPRKARRLHAKSFLVLYFWLNAKVTLLRPSRVIITWTKEKGLHLCSSQD